MSSEVLATQVERAAKSAGLAVVSSEAGENAAGATAKLAIAMTRPRHVNLASILMQVMLLARRLGRRSAFHVAAGELEAGGGRVRLVHLGQPGV